MISLPQALPGRNNWNIFHPQRAPFQVLAPKFLFSLFLPCFTSFSLISNVQKNQKKGFIFKEWNIALTFKDKGPHSFLANPCAKARTSLVAQLVNNPAGEGIGSDGKESACNAGDLGLIPGLGRCPGEGNSNPPQYSGLENPTDRGAWRATIRGVATSRARLSDLHLVKQGQGAVACE